MARLGEILIAARLVEPDKLDQALRAQVMWGGRLGTNLIELGCIDLDELSRALGRQHAVPAALARHFEKSDPELQQQLPAQLAERWSVVPLVHVGPDRKIAVVAIDPLPAQAIGAIADALGVASSMIVTSVAAEMRVRYHLERVYGIPRATRYLRSRGKTITPFPQFDDFELPVDDDIEIPITVEEDPPPPPPPPPPASGTAEDVAALIDAAIETVTPPAAEPGGRERRTYVKTLADEEPATPVDQRLARISIKRIALPATERIKVVEGTTEPGPTDAALPAETLAEATRAIKRGPNRDRVAELVVEALQRLVPSCDAGLLLVIRGDVAISWKHFCRTGAPAPELAVPLDQAGLVPTVIASKATAHHTAAQLGPIDRRLVSALGASGDLAVAPIAIGDRVMCVIAAVMQPDQEIANLEAIAAAASAAFARLIRDASR